MVWDALDDFHTTDNTSDATWQYLDSPSIDANDNYSLFTTYGTAPGPGCNAWNSGRAWQFLGLEPVATPTELRLHPFNLLTSAIGWKSPIVGTVDAEFSLIDRAAGGGNGIEYRLYQSGVSTALSTGSVANGSSSGTISLSGISVSLNDVLYLVVGCGGTDSTHDLTGFSFTITAVPEPSAAILTLCAIGGLLCYAWRRGR